MQQDAALMPLDAAGMTLVGGADATPNTPQSTGERRVPRALTANEKAAVIVRLLLNDGADIAIEALPEELQETLAQQMGRMGLVDRITLEAVAGEFADALEGIGLSFPNGLAGALSVMDGKIAPAAAARLREQAGVSQSTDPWDRLRAMEVTALVDIAHRESVEIAAVMLSKLESDKAADLLGLLPGPLARRIAFAISRTGSIAPIAVERIGQALLEQIDNTPSLAFDHGPEKRVGEILNRSPAATREDVMEALEEGDSKFASDVRKVLFTFKDIATRIAPRDIPSIVRGVNQDTLITAFAGATSEADTETCAFILSNLSTRLADGLRDEIADRGQVKIKDAEAALAEIVAVTRRLIDGGDIAMIEPDDPEDAG